MTEARVLGAVELVGRGGEVVDVTPRVRRLLAALVVREGAVASVDWLVEAVWGDDVPAHAEGALQTLISRLRALLRRHDVGLEVLTRSPGYQVRAAREALDVRRFEHLLQQAATAAPAAERRRLLGEALGLWRGPPYGEFAGESFAEAEAARLAELRARAVEDQAEAALAVGDDAAAVAALAALVEEHPFRERPHELLMRALHRAGRTAEALTTFRSLRSRLREELGIEPSPGLQRLNTDILRADPRLRPEPAAGTVARAFPGIPVLASGGRLVGRDDDRRDLAAAVGQHRLVTVTGPGGIGKTSLALAVAADVAADAVGGVVGGVVTGTPDGSAAATVCELAAVPADAPLAAAVCTMLRVPVGSDRDPAQTLVSALADRDLLVVLDSCEHVAAEAGRLALTLLRGCPRVRLLATSRGPLRLPQEAVFALAPLATPDPGSTPPEVLARSPAVALFLERARQRVREFVPDEEGIREVASLCRRLDGLPLAIELAATRMDTFTAGELLERLPWRLTVLRGGPVGDPRHRSLRALVDWSFDRLQPSEQALFEIVSVFAGPFTVGDVERLLAHLGDQGPPPDGRVGEGDTWADLAGLVEQSMVSRGRGRDGFGLLETMRTYGQDRVRGERGDGVRRAHATMYADLAEDGYPDIYGPGQLARVARWEEAMADLRQAFAWAAEHDLDLAARIAGGLAALVEQKMLGEVVDWADWVVAAAEAEGRPAGARALAVAASGARFRGDLDRAADLASRALALAGVDAGAAAYAELLLSETRLFRGDLAGLEASRARIGALKDIEPRLLPLSAILDIDAQLARGYHGDVTAEAEIREILVRAERAGWPLVAAWARYARGELLAETDPELAGALLTEAVGEARSYDERYLLGVAMVSVASVRARHGDPEEAREPFADVVRHWRAQGDWTHQWTTLRNVLALLVRLGRTEPAAVLAAALLDESRSDAVGFGADEDRLRRTAAGLVTALGRDRYDDLAARGRGLSDAALVSFVLAALDS